MSPLFLELTLENGANVRINHTAIVYYKNRYEDEKVRGANVYVGTMLQVLSVKETAEQIDELV